MKLHKTLIICILAALTVTLSNCNYGRNCVNASGKEVSQTRNIDEFTKINVGGSVKVFLKQGAQQSVQVKASDNIQPLLETKVRGGELIIDMDRNVCHSGDITIYITVKNLEGISTSGDVEVITENKFHIQDLTIDISGSCRFNLDLDAKNIKTSCSGDGVITLKGMAISHYVNVSGSTTLHALNMPVGKYDVEASGSCNLEMFVVNDLNVESSGSSEITYRGNPKTVNNRGSGSSSLKKIQ